VLGALVEDDAAREETSWPQPEGCFGVGRRGHSVCLFCKTKEKNKNKNKKKS
jgi:hypothetical protein